MSTDAVADYLLRIGTTPLLDAEQEVDLAERIQAGLTAASLLAAGERSRELQLAADDGAKAREQLVLANLRLVVAIAKRYRGRGLPFLDLVQAGNTGLMLAVEHFDPSRGRFIACASLWIKRDIARGLADEARTIRLPRRLAAEVHKLARAQSLLRQDLGREATLEELAREVGISVPEVAKIKDYGLPTVSLDALLDVGAA